MDKKIVFTLILFFAGTITQAAAQTPPATPPPAELKIGGAVQTPLTLTTDDLKKIPRKTLIVINPHSLKNKMYEGASLEEILRKAGAPNGQQMRGPAWTTHVLAEAAGNYRVVFSLAELDTGFLDSDIIVADTLDGAPLSEKEGPFKIVAPHEKRPARRVRMLKSINVSSHRKSSRLVNIVCLRTYSCIS